MYRDAKRILGDAKRILGMQKSLKEARMKKLVLIMVALFLVIPALSDAGSMTSRYDVKHLVVT